MTLAADRRREKKVEKQRQRELSLRQHFEREKRRNPDFVMPPNDFISTSAVEESTSGILSRKAVLKQKVKEHINVGKARMRNDPRPIDPTCQCYTCKNFSRAYLHHTFKAKESVGGTLVRYLF